jgi:predicted thioesterase
MVEIESRGQPPAQRLSSVTTVQVEFKDTVAAVIPTMPPVAATPYLVMIAEIACTNLVLDRLGPGQITVGTRVVIDHLGASKVGATLTLHTEFVGRETNWFKFSVRIKDAERTVAKIEHERAAVAFQKIMNALS